MSRGLDSQEAVVEVPMPEELTFEQRASHVNNAFMRLGFV
jgi:hypothetical protein